MTTNDSLYQPERFESPIVKTGVQKLSECIEFPDIQMGIQNLPGISDGTLYDTPKTAKDRDYSLADYSYDVLVERIKEFEERLDDDHETAVKLTSFGQTVTLSVTNIGYSNPSTLIFSGYVGGQPATLIQHMSQLNFLLFAAKKSDPEKPPRRIGFAAPSED